MSKRDYATDAAPVAQRPSVPVIDRLPRFPKERPVVACTEKEDRARQEYKASSDLAYQVQRFGVGAHPVYGNVDWDSMDLTRAFEIVEESRRRWSELPAAVRDRYASWSAVEAAARSGELDQVLQAAGLTPAVGVGSDASARDSAPVTPPKGDSAS